MTTKRTPLAASARRISSGRNGRSDTLGDPTSPARFADGIHDAVEEPGSRGRVERQLVVDLAVVDVVVAAEPQIGLEAAGLENAPQRVDPGDVEPTLPAGHRGLCGTEPRRELRLRQAGDRARFADQHARLDTTECHGIRAIRLGHGNSISALEIYRKRRRNWTACRRRQPTGRPSRSAIAPGLTSRRSPWSSTSPTCSRSSWTRRPTVLR